MPQPLKVDVKDDPVEVIGDAVSILLARREEQGLPGVHGQFLAIAFIKNVAAENQVDRADARAGTDGSLDGCRVAARQQQVAHLAAAGAMQKLLFMPLSWAEIHHRIVLGQAVSQGLGVPVDLGQSVVKDQRVCLG